ncbi:MAG: hypothetical protein ACYCOU_00370 [Sulfobacillus sp.]
MAEAQQSTQTSLSDLLSEALKRALEIGRVLDDDETDDDNTDQPVYGPDGECGSVAEAGLTLTMMLTAKGVQYEFGWANDYFESRAFGETPETAISAWLEAN